MGCLQLGQSLRMLSLIDRFSHSRMQLEWKQCPHRRVLTLLSSLLRVLRQIEQKLSMSRAAVLPKVLFDIFFYNINYC